MTIDTTFCKKCGTDFSKKAVLKVFKNEAVAKRYEHVLELVQKKKFKKALKVLDELLQGSPKNSVLWNDKGYILKTLGRKDEARLAFENALEYDPDYHIAQVNLNRLS
jgi:Flp pilus assembly protein TadD